LLLLLVSSDREGAPLETCGDFLPCRRSEWIDRGEESGLHVIILDEMDAFAKKRGLLRGDTTGVRDSVVNQLLAIMDGVREIDNFLVMILSYQLMRAQSRQSSEQSGQNSDGPLVPIDACTK
jgi:SpoVK/Ycf46/Vps4 family AAA+-type ATPase